MDKTKTWKGLKEYILEKKPDVLVLEEMLINCYETIDFITKCFEWEKESTKAVVRVDKYEISCNLGTKLLFFTDEGITEKNIPFLKKGIGYRCNLLRLFRDEGIPYTEGTGFYCDGAGFTQKDSSAEALYCKKAIIEHTGSPYWGEQFELRMVDDAKRLKIGGKRVKILRFNQCDLNRQNKIEDWLSGLIEKDQKLDAYELEKQVRRFVKGSVRTCVLYYQKTDDSYEWTYFEGCKAVGNK